MQPLGGGTWGLGILFPLIAAGTLRVIQEPAELQVTAGDTVALGCQVEVAESQGGALLRLEWVRAGGLGGLCATRLHFDTPWPQVPCAPHVPRLQLAWQPPRATLSLLQVQGSDSGCYLCRVTLEIPRYGTATGNGTELSVSPAAVGGRQAALLWWLLGGLGGTALLLGMVLLGYCCCHRSSDTAIYLNTKPRSARNPRKRPPPPRLKNNPYEQALRWAQGSPVPPWR